MITPLRNWKNLKRGYTFGAPTNYNNFHVGLDLIVPKGTEIYAPFDGFVKTASGKQGGNMIYFEPEGEGEGGTVIRFLHLSEFKKTGEVKEGDIIALSGNSGNSPIPHLHVDVSKYDFDLSETDNFLDPEIFFNQRPMKLPITLVNAPELILSGFKARIEDYLFNQVLVEFRPLTLLFDPPTKGMLTQDQAYKIADQAGGRFIFIFYPPNFTSTFYASYYYPKGDCSITTAPGVDIRLLCFEMAHQLQYYYNQHRGSNPFIQVEDSHFPDEEFIQKKFNSVIPYLSLILGPGAGKGVMTKEEVRLVYVLAFYREPDKEELEYWTGKPLANMLKEAIKDRSLFLAKEVSK